MNHPPFPGLKELLGRWRKERLVRMAGPVAVALGMAMLLFLALLIWFSPSRAVLIGLGIGVGGCWIAAAGWLVSVYRRKPTPAVLARRVDAVLSLPDDLLALSEWPSGQEAWRCASWQKSCELLAAIDFRAAWPVPLPRATLCIAAAALVLTFAVGMVGRAQWQGQERALALEEAARQERQALSMELFDDWKEFVELTDDPELKKLFTDAVRLQQALEARDPMHAMLEINRVEEEISALEASTNRQSLASEAGAMAEALEAFEGMGALGAALRRHDFSAAAQEAEQRLADFARDPEGSAALRREAAVAEMLAEQAQRAAAQGQESLSGALGDLSAAAGSKKDALSHRDLAKPTRTLRNEFAQEARRQEQGRMAAMGRQQLDTLRRRLRGEKQAENPFPSLCLACANGSGNKPGKGKGAGSGTTGQAQGEATLLGEAAVQEQVTGSAGEGDSETVTLSAASGSGAVQAAARPTNFSDYVELSKKAVSDENLPLAHRRVIRTYFEQIRPMGTSE